MTHEDLLKRIEILIADFCEGEYCATCAPYKALRAVVELHQPIWTFIDGSNKSVPLCIQCRDGNFEADYPCSTIQAIESELK